MIKGNGKEIQRYPKGTIAVEGEYRQGNKDGYWYGRHRNGELYYEEIYERGRLIRGKSRTLSGKTFVYDASSLFPLPEGGLEKLNRYLSAKADEDQSSDAGRVKISFRVTPKGVLTDVSIIESASPALNQKAKEILLNGPRWVPAKLHGHEPVDGLAVVSIQFH